MYRTGIVHNLYTHVGIIYIYICLYTNAICIDNTIHYIMFFLQIATCIAKIYNMYYTNAKNYTSFYVPFFLYYGKNPPAPSQFTTPRHSRLENSKIGVQGLRRFNKVVAWLPNEALVPKNVGGNEGWWKSPKGTIYP